MELIDIEDFSFGCVLQKQVVHDDKTKDFEFVQVNKAFENIFCVLKESLIGKCINEILSNFSGQDHVMKQYLKYLDDILRQRGQDEYEIHIHQTDKYYKLKIEPLKNNTYISYLFDITNQVKYRELLQATFFSMRDGAIATLPDFSIYLMNKPAERIVGTQIKKAEGKQLSQVLYLYEQNGCALSFENMIENTAMESENCLKRYQALNTETGEHTQIEFRLVPILYHKEELGYLINIKDVSEKILAENKISYMTYHDALTGLYNRTFFNEKVYEFEKKEYLPVSIIMGDVNGLKLTNDAFGHLLGDELLKTAGNTIESACRETDILFRWGGDEFVVLLPHTDEKVVKQICKRIQKHTQEKKIDFLSLSISLGYATRNNSDKSFNQILKEAEDMMYDIKLLESKSVKSKTMRLISRTLYERDKSESLHAERVGKLCELIGQAMKLDESAIAELVIWGKVHDIGKVGIDQNILIKSDKLNDIEWEAVKRHPEIGYHILVSSNEMAKIAEYVLAHHERVDGKGYPKNLKLNEIPLQSKILAVADAYDAMTSKDRTYQETKSPKEAKQELNQCVGTQFDFNVVTAFNTISPALIH